VIYNLAGIQFHWQGKMVKTSAPPQADKIFAGKTFVLQGDFGRYPRTHVNIAKLIARHGGRVDAMVTDRTNLVVTTLDEFRKRTPASMSAFISLFSLFLCYFDILFL
jgi:NAD-dependent DNA ligase